MHRLPGVRQTRNFTIFDAEDAESAVRAVLISEMESEGITFDKVSRNRSAFPFFSAF